MGFFDSVGGIGGLIVAGPIGAVAGYGGEQAIGAMGGGQDWQPTMANIGAPASIDMRQNAEEMAGALAAQRQLMSELGGTGGLYGQAITNYGNLLQGQQGVLGQQQALADQLAMQAQGGGPNPALAQLALTTGQNIGQQAALMAGQRGGRNAGLMSRQAAEAGGGIQQQAAGQAAVMRGQQQLAAQQQLAQQQGLMGVQQANMGQGIGQYAQMGAQRLQQQQQANQIYQQSLLAQQGLGLGAQGQYNATLAGMQGNVNQSMAAIRAAELARSGQVIGGAFQGIGAAAGLAAKGAYQGGVIQQDSKPALINIELGASHGGKVDGAANVAGDSPKNDSVVTALSPGEVVIPRSKVNDEQKVAAFLNALLGFNLKPGRMAA